MRLLSLILGLVAVAPPGLATHLRAPLPEVAVEGQLGRRAVQQMPQPMQGPLPDANQVLQGICTGYPEPRRYAEVQSWWTDEGHDIASQSKHFHLGACVPSGTTIDTDILTVDIAIKIHNMQGTGRRITWIGGYGLRPRMVEKELGGKEVDYGCEVADCSYVLRLPLDMKKLNKGNRANGNGPMNLELFGLVEAPKTQNLPEDNEFASLMFSWLYQVEVPGLSSAPRLTNTMSDTPEFLAWGRRPWQYGFIDLASGRPPETVSGVLDLSMWMGPANRDNMTPEPADSTGLFIAVDPAFHAVPPKLGTIIMDFPQFTRKELDQSVFIDTRQLPNGKHSIFLRLDCFISAARLPSVPIVPKFNKPNGLSNLGGTYSTVMVISVDVRN